MYRLEKIFQMTSNGNATNKQKKNNCNPNATPLSLKHTKRQNRNKIEMNVSNKRNVLVVVVKFVHNQI